MITVVGAGLAGLACAVGLLDAGCPVQVLEAAGFGGGRCRSYHDALLGMRIDNGNHLLLSGNAAAHGFLRRLGTADTLSGPGAPVFPFMDLASGERWTLRPGMGRAPWWVFDPARRVPGSTLGEYVRLVRWLRVPACATVAGVSPQGLLYRRLIEPLAVSALNTMADVADAGLMAAVLRGSLLAGGGACVPSFPREGLSESFVQPAVDLLAGAMRFGRRVSGLVVADGRVAGIDTPEGTEPVGPADGVVLAVPAPAAAGLLPWLVVPDAFEAILNVHFRLDADPGEAGFVGLVGGFAEWVFVKAGVVSVTISAANRYAERTPVAVVEAVWGEVARVLGLNGPMPRWRVVREKRATFAATPAQVARRPGAQVPGLANLWLAGDWTDTGLPATIEGAIRSGQRAARLAQGRAR